MTTDVHTNIDNWGWFQDGTDTGSQFVTGLSANQNPSQGDLSLDTTYLIRFDVYESNGGSWKNVAGQLEYNHESTGWTNVNASSSYVRSAGDANSALTDGNDVSSIRLGGSFTLDSTNEGQDTDDGSAGGGSADFNNTGAEFVYAFQIRSADVSANDVIQLRITVPQGVQNNIPAAWPSYTVGNAVNVNLTGETANAADGTLTGSVDADLTGETANAADGTLSSTTDVDLTGETANAADGTLTPSTPAGVAHYPVDYILLREPGLYVPNQKPTGPVKIDWSHPMTVGLQAAFIFSPWNGIIGNPEAGDETTRDLTGNGHDILWQTAPTLGPYSNDTYNEFGYGIKATATSNHYGWIVAGNIPAAGEDIYAMAWAGIGENAGTGLFTIYGPTGGSTDLQMWHGSAGYQFQPYNCADSPNETVFYTGAGSGVLDNRISVAYWNDTANSTQGAYTLKNRTPASFSDTLTSDPLPTSGRKLLFLTDADSEGTDGDGTLGNWYQGVIEYWYCWNRKLSEAEGHSINIDPYQFVVPV
jgi:hypothetical protein